MNGQPVRASDADRDRVLRLLRDRAVEGRLSHETFERRVDRALRASSQAELTELVHDLPPAGRLVRGLTGVITSVSAATARMEAAWRAPRLPRLTLPPIGPARLRIGRAPACEFLVTDMTVSRVHAELFLCEGHWMLADLGSMNGTRVNGHRIVAPTRVCPGDEVGFGERSFILTVSGCR